MSSPSAVTDTQTSLYDLGHSDPIVMGVLYVLLAISLLTWVMIVYKALEMSRASRANTEFAKQFWDSKDAVQWLIHSSPTLSGPLAKLTASGLEALRHYHSHSHQGAAGMVGNLPDTLTRSLRQSIQDQLTHYEAGLGTLATIGNTAPFIGLFGTVIGMMAALQSISASGSTELSVVAGPIGEALIATAAGIGCAVPAVVAYNSFLRRLKVFSNTLDSFAYDLLAHLASERAMRAIAASEAEGKRAEGGQ